MDVEVSTNAIMDTNEKRRRNKRWPEALKREIVAATLVPGASVSVVARQYDVNVNQVFAWRRRLGSSVAPIPTTSPSQRPMLVEVLLAPNLPEQPARPTSPSTPIAVAQSATDLIEIEVSGTYRVRVGANFDAHALRRLLDVLVIR
jgi:transposase